MITLIRCKNCNAEGHPVGSVTARIVLAKSKHCNVCHRSHDDERMVSFCSVSCLIEYIQNTPEELMQEADLFAGK